MAGQVARPWFDRRPIATRLPPPASAGEGGDGDGVNDAKPGSLGEFRLPYLLAGVLLVAGVVAPLLDVTNSSASAVLYGVLRAFCHLNPNRCWHIAGHQVGLCHRCLPLVVAVLVSRSIPRLRSGCRTCGLALILPLVADGGASLSGLWTASQISRAVTGSLAGFGLHLYMAGWAKAARSLTVGNC